MQNEQNTEHTAKPVNQDTGHLHNLDTFGQSQGVLNTQVSLVA